MRQIRSQVDIAAPAQRVWDVLTGFSAFPAWNPFIREAHGALRPGARLAITLRLGRRHISFRPVLTVVDEPRELRWLVRQRVPGLFEVDRRFLLEPLDGAGCRFVQSESASGIFSPLLMLWMGGRILRGYEAFNVAIKERVEQDCR